MDHRLLALALVLVLAGCGTIIGADDPQEEVTLRTADQAATVTRDTQVTVEVTNTGDGGADSPDPDMEFSEVSVSGEVVMDGDEPWQFA